VDALIIQLQNGKEKFGGVTMAFDEVNVATIAVEKTTATKVVDKMRLIKYGKNLVEGKLKTICTTKQVHLAFQMKEPSRLELGPCAICGNWFPYMDVETTSCGHIYHPNCLWVHLQELVSYKKCGQFLHPLWFNNKGIQCVEKEEYEKQRLDLGLDDQVKKWLEHQQIATIHPDEPTSIV
jgi:hypothetical protein